MTRALLKLCGKTEALIRHVTDRPGHDRRYAVDCAKAEAELGWRPTVAFERGPGRDRRVVPVQYPMGRASGYRVRLRSP